MSFHFSLSTEVTMAFHKFTWQSSILGDDVSSKAVDGNTKTCTRTMATFDQTWSQDLRHDYVISVVEIISPSVGKQILSYLTLVL